MAVCGGGVGWGIEPLSGKFSLFVVFQTEGDIFSQCFIIPLNKLNHNLKMCFALNIFV